MALKLRRKANILSLSLYPATFQERNFNYWVQLSRISVMTNKILKKMYFILQSSLTFKRRRFKKWLFFFTLLIIFMWVTTVHNLWKLLLRELVHWDKYYLVDTASSFCLLLIPRSFKKNLCPLINKGDMKKALVYIIFSPLGKGQQYS